MSTDLKNPAASGMNYKVVNQPSITMPDSTEGGNSGWVYGAMFFSTANGAVLNISAPSDLHCIINMAYSTGSPNTVHIRRLTIDGVDILLPPDSGGDTAFVYLNKNNASSESSNSYPSIFALIGVPFKTLTIELGGSGAAHIGWCDVEVQ
ncbi:MULTISPECIES: hypothetical protein [Vibrio]|uniref:hypothetical protein n=1 Tax=Vibrio TaxID=662 RepID=UPI00222ECBCE|nr:MULTISPECIES: hypothetical protein [Vibrio]MDV5034805.1 hypothetical protein [Vibrio diabolicus]BDR21106.1 hypothetical protein VspSTUT16_44520 [Vibrio sp. STUT-A16]